MGDWNLYGSWGNCKYLEHLRASWLLWFSLKLEHREDREKHATTFGVSKEELTIEPRGHGIILITWCNQQDSFCSDLTRFRQTFFILHSLSFMKPLCMLLTCIVVFPPSSRAMANRMLSWKTRSVLVFMMRSMTRSDAPSRSKWHWTSARDISARLRPPTPIYQRPHTHTHTLSLSHTPRQTGSRMPFIRTPSWKSHPSLLDLVML